MKLSDYVRGLFARAAIESTVIVRAAPIVEPPRPKIVGQAPTEFRRPLLIGRHGKLTRKLRKARNEKSNKRIRSI